MTQLALEMVARVWVRLLGNQDARNTTAFIATDVPRPRFDCKQGPVGRCLHLVLISGQIIPDCRAAVIAAVALTMNHAHLVMPGPMNTRTGGNIIFDGFTTVRLFQPLEKWIVFSNDWKRRSFLLTVEKNDRFI